MAVFQELVDFNHMFQCLRETPIIINDLIISSEEDKEELKKLIYTKYTSDMLSILPSCDCGKTQGEQSLGVKCAHCETEVKSQVEESIEPLIWFRRPNGVAKLINPQILIMLNEVFKKSNFEIIPWICDTTYKSHVTQPKILENILATGIVRGYNNFVENFDSIIETLFSFKDFYIRPTANDLKQIIKENRHLIFSDYMPLPNKSLLIIEKNDLGTFMDNTITGAIDAISMLASIDSPLSIHSVKVKENRTIKSIVKLIDYYQDFNKHTVSGKTGILRRNTLGTRSHYTFRAVATSITGVHHYQDLEIPWGVGVTLFRQHLINKLLKLGYDYNEAVGYLHGHVNRHSDLLKTLFNELITEAGYKGIPCVLNRNPGLMMGSVLFLYIKKVKDNIKDQTVSLSVLIIKSLNCDFDGDELNVYLPLDDILSQLLEAFAPHKNVFILNKPKMVSDNVYIPKTVIATFSNWLSHPVLGHTPTNTKVFDSLCI